MNKKNYSSHEIIMNVMGTYYYMKRGRDVGKIRMLFEYVVNMVKRLIVRPEVSVSSETVSYIDENFANADDEIIAGMICRVTDDLYPMRKGNVYAKNEYPTTYEDMVEMIRMVKYRRQCGRR